MADKHDRAIVLEVPVDLVSGEQAMGIIGNWAGQPEITGAKHPVLKNSKHRVLGPPRHIVTAYSEFFVRAHRDPGFKAILQSADLVLPDGVGPLASIDYQKRKRPGLANSKLQGLALKKLKTLTAALQTGRATLTGRVGTPVTGVWLTRQILKLSPQKHWRVYLLGGFGDTSQRLAVISTLRAEREEEKSFWPERSRRRGYDQDSFTKQAFGFPPTSTSPRHQTESDDRQLRSVKNLIHASPGVQNLASATPADHQKTIAEINKFQPDILLVAYGPVQQEKWISKYKSMIKAKIIIGVGGSFDELTGRASPAPQWMQSHGLKWLWRLITQPKRIKRMWNAVIVFPYLVWRSQ